MRWVGGEKGLWYREKREGKYCKRRGENGREGVERGHEGEGEEEEEEGGRGGPEKLIW